MGDPLKQYRFRLFPECRIIRQTDMDTFRLIKEVVIGRARNLSDKRVFLQHVLWWRSRLGGLGVQTACPPRGYGPEAAYLAFERAYALELALWRWPLFWTIAGHLRQL